MLDILLSIIIYISSLTIFILLNLFVAKMAYLSIGNDYELKSYTQIYDSLLYMYEHKNELLKFIHRIFFTTIKTSDIYDIYSVAIIRATFISTYFTSFLFYCFFITSFIISILGTLKISSEKFLEWLGKLDNPVTSLVKILGGIVIVSKAVSELVKVYW